MSAIVNADLFRIVSNFISSEETRYYLKGVLIQRHQLKGVYLVATDGHRMMIAHDENGTVDADIIVRLDKAAMAACKPVKYEPGERLLQVSDEGVAQVMSGTETPLPVAISHDAIIDGTFPDWRRVVPREDAECAPETFAHKYLSDFCDAAKDLDKTASKNVPAAIRVYGGGGNPAIIRFRGVDNAFGVLMPLRDPDIKSPRLPWFMNAAPAEMAVAAE